MLEYVLLVGDWNGAYSIPTFTISSYNEEELDVTDYTYTYINNDIQTTVAILNKEARLEELARMLSGAKITDAARKAAKSLLISQA